jgi:hypothetical protein
VSLIGLMEGQKESGLAGLDEKGDKVFKEKDISTI